MSSPQYGMKWHPAVHMPFWAALTSGGVCKKVFRPKRFFTPPDIIIILENPKSQMTLEIRKEISIFYFFDLVIKYD
jgi:hypothetical protein